MFDSRVKPDLTTEAEKVGHPDPENATWGEVNILSIACIRNGDTPVSAREASHILRVAEFDAGWHD